MQPWATPAFASSCFKAGWIADRAPRLGPDNTFDTFTCLVSNQVSVSPLQNLHLRSPAPFCFSAASLCFGEWYTPVQWSLPSHVCFCIRGPAVLSLASAPGIEFGCSITDTNSIFLLSTAALCLKQQMQTCVHWLSSLCCCAAMNSFQNYHLTPL